MTKVDYRRFKNSVFLSCQAHLNEKIQRLEEALRELKLGTENESKSSAGDKHETARAMMHLEQEKLAMQLDELLRQKNELLKIEVSNTAKQITKGSLIKTNKGFLFLSVGIGKIVTDDIPVFSLSMQSPLGKNLMGMEAGGELTTNGMQYVIEEVW